MSISPEARPFQIPATPERAKEVQSLSLQDMIAAGWENPLDVVNPDDDEKVQQTVKRMKSESLTYLGIDDDEGALAAYMKLGIWDRINQFAFATDEEKEELQKGFRWKGKPVVPRTLAIYGLVASERYVMDVRKRMIETFAHEAIFRSQGGQYGPGFDRINIVIHGNDPVQSVVEELNFRPIATGEATNVSGLEQTLYQKIITGHEY